MDDRHTVYRILNSTFDADVVSENTGHFQILDVDDL